MRTCSASVSRLGSPGGAEVGLVPDIVRTWRRPRAVMAEKIADGTEGLALAYLMIACGLVFVGQWPVLAREAHLTGQEVQPLIGGALLAWLFIMPLALYVLAGIVHLVSRLVRRPVPPFAARMALFWGLMAAVPLWLLNGLTAGLVGEGPALTLVGLFALAAFLWFVVSGLRAGRAAA